MNRSAFITRLRSLTGAVASPRLEPALLAVTASALTAGGAAWLAGDAGLADLLWGLGTLAAVPPYGRRPDRGSRSRWHPRRP
jgi:hypothetical protein